MCGHRLTLPFLALLLGAGVAAGAGGRGSGRMTAEQIAAKYLQLGDAELERPEPGKLAAIRAGIADLEFEGLALAAPRRLPAGGAQLPVLLVSQERGLRAHQVPAAPNTFLLVVDTAGHRTWVVPAFRAAPGKMPPPRPAAPRPAPEGVSAIALLTQATPADAAPGEGTLAGAGRLAVTALRYDWASNTVEIEHGAAAPAGLTMAAAPAPDAGGPPPGRPAQGFLAGPGIPAPAGDAPLALAFEVLPGGAVVVRGSLKAAQPALAPAAPRLREVDGKERTVTAVVPMTLLVASLGVPPRQVELGVPAYADAPPGGPRAHFAVDLLRGGRPLPAGEHVVWAVLGGKLLGPWRFRT
jgi:hypothetical protein